MIYWVPLMGLEEGSDVGAGSFDRAGLPVLVDERRSSFSPLVELLPVSLA